MPVQYNITLDMFIAEEKRILQYMDEHYNDFVKQGKITPYDRDHRKSLHKKMLQLLTDAKKNKATNGKTFVQIINQLP
jgi:hypothetical protein